MRRKSVMPKVPALAAVLCLCVVSGAQANTIRNRLEAFEFFGRWAPDCAAPASPTNAVRDVSVAPDGTVAFTESLGADYEPNVYVVLGAKRASADKIVVRVQLNRETEQELTMQRRHGRLRTMQNRLAAGGALVVANGVALRNKQKTPWLSPCADRP